MLVTLHSCSWLHRLVWSTYEQQSGQALVALLLWPACGCHSLVQETLLQPWKLVYFQHFLEMLGSAQLQRSSLYGTLCGLWQICLHHVAWRVLISVSTLLYSLDARTGSSVSNLH